MPFQHELGSVSIDLFGSNIQANKQGSSGLSMTLLGDAAVGGQNICPFESEVGSVSIDLFGSNTHEGARTHTSVGARAHVRAPVRVRARACDGRRTA